MKAVELNGAEGEGGGQILRSALTLSMLTGMPFKIDNIRAGREKPGLLRQHLTATAAAAAVCGALVEGAKPGSTALSFVPGPISAGDYEFAVGTAGSCTLVLQTVLPALWFAGAPSTITVFGGTHNDAAPPADFLIRSWLPLVSRMGLVAQIDLIRHGFYPAGGGQIRASVSPAAQLVGLELGERGAAIRQSATSIVAGVPSRVAERELVRLQKLLDGLSLHTRALPSSEGPGNVAMVELEYENLTEIFTAFGERGVSAERVADNLAAQVRGYIDGGAAVGEALSDQLLLPLAIARAGSFTTAFVSSHLTTNIAVIQKFLPVRFDIQKNGSGFRISVR